MKSPLHTTRLTAYNAPSICAQLVPVEIPAHTGNCAASLWNKAVRRWHRRAGQ